jgi:Xaa-Pro aminopeptidase
MTVFARERLSEGLQAAGLDAVVVRDPCFWTYLAGFGLPGTLGRHLSWIGGPRPNLAVFTAAGARILLVDSIAGDLCRLRAGDDVATYEAYRDDPFDMLAELLRARLGAGARLGVDRPGSWLWSERPGGIPFAHAPADALLRRVMARKTAAEVERIRDACRHLDDAHAMLASDPPARCTEASLHARVVGWCLERGSHHTHGILNVERNEILYAGESQMEVVPGDLVRTDYVAYFDGYPGHLSRLLFRGTPSRLQRERYARLLDVHRSSIEGCRPGLTGGDVHRLVARQFEKHGIRYDGKIAGHGIGPWFHQQGPVIAAASTEPIESGMALAIEPCVGSWHLQDVILVGESGNTVLSDRIDTSQPLVI